MDPISRLTELFEKFPGIGPRQARRFVQYLLSQQQSYRTNLADSIRFLGSQTSQCTLCFRWYVKEKDAKLCSVCASASRERGVLFVVEKDADIDTVERSGFRGLYFVLGGTIPLASEELSKFRVKELLQRVEKEAAPQGVKEEARLKEVILGLSATTEGDHTRLILQEKLLPIAQGLGFKISSLGRGLSTGSELEYADPDTIASALSSRQ
jgi:recombination protein RecR